jgi:hypothetical protein
MQKKIGLFVILYIALTYCITSEEDLLKINANVEPRYVKQGEEGALKIKITPRNGIKISSHPEFLIRLDKNNNFSFSKLFFTASELDFQTRQENESVFLELEKEVNILFKVNEDSLIGKNTISGEVVYTAVYKDNWSLKTYQRFNVDFFSQRNQKTKLKKK